MNNFEKIKSMDIEELTEWLVEFTKEYVCDYDTIMHQLLQEEV